MPELSKVLGEDKNKAATKDGFDQQQFPQEQTINLGVLGKGKKRTHEELAAQSTDSNITKDFKKPKPNDP